MLGAPVFRTALYGPWSGNALWTAARVAPSLDLRFADNKSLTDAVTGASLITFTRASTATFIDSAGVLQTAATDEPRFDHNPTTGESLGLLVEEQRTNLLLRSEEFDNASWVKTLATVTADAGVAPSGLTVADKLIGNSTVDAHYAQQNISGATNGISYTSSVYAKAAEISRIEILHVVGAVLYAQGYDLSNGTLLTRVTGGTTAATGGFIQSVGNGWYRCGITQTSDGTSGAMRVTLRSANTVAFDATSQGVLLWGAQLEAGAFPTSYIPTTTAAATRSADVASITGTNFSSWYNATQGTTYTSAQVGYAVPAGSFPVVAAINDGTASNRLEYGYLTATLAGFGVVLGGVDQGSVYSATTAVVRNLAAAYQAGNGAASVNGNAVLTLGSMGVPVVNRLTLGTAPAAGNILNGTIKRFVYWPQRLPNSTLQQLAA